jgi:hypothetical protein
VWRRAEDADELFLSWSLLIVVQVTVIAASTSTSTPTNSFFHSSTSIPYSERSPLVLTG